MTASKHETGSATVEISAELVSELGRHTITLLKITENQDETMPNLLIADATGRILTDENQEEIGVVTLRGEEHALLSRMIDYLDAARYTPQIKQDLAANTEYTAGTSNDKIKDLLGVLANPEILPVVHRNLVAAKIGSKKLYWLASDTTDRSPRSPLATAYLEAEGYNGEISSQSWLEIASQSAISKIEWLKPKDRTKNSSLTRRLAGEKPAAEFDTNQVAQSVASMTYGEIYDWENFFQGLPEPLHPAAEARANMVMGMLYKKYGIRFRQYRDDDNRRKIEMLKPRD